MTIARSYIDQLLNPDPTRTRIIRKTPYTLGGIAEGETERCLLRFLQ